MILFVFGMKTTPWTPKTDTLTTSLLRSITAKLIYLTRQYHICKTTSLTQISLPPKIATLHRISFRTVQMIVSTNIVSTNVDCDVSTVRTVPNNVYCSVDFVTVWHDVLIAFIFCLRSHVLFEYTLFCFIHSHCYQHKSGGGWRILTGLVPRLFVGFLYPVQDSFLRPLSPVHSTLHLRWHAKRYMTSFTLRVMQHAR